MDRCQCCGWKPSGMDWFAATVGQAPLLWVGRDRLCRTCIWTIHDCWPQAFAGLLTVKGVMIEGVSGG